MDNLRTKVAGVFTASGAIAGAVARSFARHSARVYVSARNFKQAQKVANEINDTGGSSEADTIDALDEYGIDAYVKKIKDTEAKIDIVFNGIGPNPTSNGYGCPSLIPLHLYNLHSAIIGWLLIVIIFTRDFD
ncbi:MAG: SDR family NAD(P)-dependent oxidoreductase [Cyclobacteriaceae bacterium]|nr:SDR family NAD(P)-dependent oxidoreductase [Cyclobacteriaceae bacterium]